MDFGLGIAQWGQNVYEFEFHFSSPSLNKLRLEIFAMNVLALHIHKFVKLISMIASISRIFIINF